MFPNTLSFGHGDNPVPSFANQGDQKWYRVVGSIDGTKIIRHDVLCKKSEVGGFFAKVARKFNAKKVTQMVIQYSIKVYDPKLDLILEGLKNASIYTHHTDTLIAI